MIRRMMVAVIGIVLLTTMNARAELPAGKVSDGIVTSEFIFENAPFPSCHASTIAETKHGLVAAWFGGTRERNPDVGIWVSSNRGGKWSAPVEVANGIQESGPAAGLATAAKGQASAAAGGTSAAVGAASARMPTWNPVLFQSREGPLMLFYKVGPAPAQWWGMMMTSKDDGATWSKPVRLPAGVLGPIKNKPVELADGTIVCGSSTENAGWVVHMEFTKDLGKTWTKTGALNEDKEVRLIQPGILDLGGGKLEILCRSRSQKVFELDSTDGGQSWSKPVATELPNPNSGIDAVQLRDGRSLVVYNHSPDKRFPLNVALSKDGKTWGPPILIEDLPDGDGQLSYPAAIQTADGMVHLTYTWNRKKIRHIVLDPAKLP